MRSFVEGTKVFVRWLHGTCKEAPPQPVEGQDEPYVYSFFQDIQNNMELSELVGGVIRSCQESRVDIEQYLHSKWKMRLLGKGVMF